ncbi:PPE domain-containing protein [Mycobacterium sp. smrl_JER01]|uniref:PPE domain-containing protein n=1 Tax=Mycobacterium sp. smrl_JER01 TaxID=3402633 RepID=UPI003ABF6862
MPVEPWGAYPPEMNAARYNGTGPGPWLGASAAWGAMAVNAATALGTFFAQKADLAAQVFGVSSAAQLTAAGGYGAWMAGMHGLADAHAVALDGAAAAYSMGKSTMVPEQAVLANRAAYAAAVGSSILGPADPTAVALEVQYVQMHAQNAATMMGYDTAATTATVFKPSPPPPPLVTAMPGQTSLESAVQTAQELSGAGNPGDLMTKMLPQAMQMIPQAAQLPAQFAQMMSSQLGQMFQPVQQVMGQLMAPFSGALGNGLGTGSTGMGSGLGQAARGAAPVRGGLPLGGGSGAMGGLGSRLATGGSGGITGELMKPTSTAVRSGPAFSGVPMEKAVATTLSSGAGGMGGGAIPPRRSQDKSHGGTEYKGGDHIYRSKSREEQERAASNAEEDALFD